MCYSQLVINVMPPPTEFQTIVEYIELMVLVLMFEMNPPVNVGEWAQSVLSQSPAGAPNLRRGGAK